MNEINDSSSSLIETFEREGLLQFEQIFRHVNSSFGFTGFVPLNETTLSYNSSNSTDGDWRNTYKAMLDLLLLIVLIIMMMSMGCEITWQNLLHHIKKPTGLFIGIFSQFCVMPLSAFCILLISGIQGLHATGILIISCCPAGAISNTFTYFCDGNLALSVAMTSASILIAMGMMPLNTWLYGRHFESADLVIPYDKMAISLITVTSPVIFGMLIKWKLPRFAAFTAKFGSHFAVLLAFFCFGMEIILFPNMFVGIPFKLYAVILTLPAIGIILGYGLATLLKQSTANRKTIAIECGIQNVPLALTVITLSFPLEMQEDIVLLPWLYCFAMISTGTVICLTYHCRKKCLKKSVSEQEYRAVKTLNSLLEGTKEDKSSNGVKITIRPKVVKNKKSFQMPTSCV